MKFKIRKLNFQLLPYTCIKSLKLQLTRIQLVWMLWFRQFLRACFLCQEFFLVLRRDPFLCAHVTITWAFFSVLSVPWFLTRHLLRTLVLLFGLSETAPRDVPQKLFVWDTLGLWACDWAHCPSHVNTVLLEP